MTMYEIVTISGVRWRFSTGSRRPIGAIRDFLSRSGRCAYDTTGHGAVLTVAAPQKRLKGTKNVEMTISPPMAASGVVLVQTRAWRY